MHFIVKILFSKRPTSDEQLKPYVVQEVCLKQDASFLFATNFYAAHVFVYLPGKKVWKVQDLPDARPINSPTNPPSPAAMPGSLVKEVLYI